MFPFPTLHSQSIPSNQTTHRAYELLAEGFGEGFNGPLLVVAKVPNPKREAVENGVVLTQVVHNEILVEFDHPVAGRFRTVGPPIEFSRTQGEIRRPPMLGEHKDEILAELGFTSAEIAGFKERKVV